MSQPRADAFREAAEIAHDMCLKRMRWRKVHEPEHMLTPIPGAGALAGKLRERFLELAKSEEMKP